MAQEASNLKSWMKKEDIYDNDLYDILSGQGVEDASEDFKTYSQKDWDELWRKGCVERAKELKDQKAKVRLEKKMKKLEKHWRKESGIKTTSVKSKKKGKTDDKPLENSAQAQKDALTQGADLKKFLQKNQCFSTDLLMVCVQQGITSEDSLDQIDSNSSFDEIYRQVRVLRAKELKDNTARMRMEKTMTKFEKLWRAKTGIKKTSVKKKSKGSKKKDPTTQKNEQLATSGAGLKKWMRKNNVWELALYDELISREITDPEQLKELKEDTFDAIVRKVRVDRFSQLKDASARNRADKLLVKFEKIWRKESGIKKTSLKK
eukprot:265669_1